MSAPPRLASAKVLMLVENLPVPFDRRVWMESTTLAQAGYEVSVICPLGKTGKMYERLEGINVYRYPLPSLGGFVGHVVEYGIALPATILLSLVVWIRHGVDVVHTANPPDLFFVIGGFFKLFGKKFVFDQHDLMPEICASRWSGFKARLLIAMTMWMERMTYRLADVVISTNDSYRQIAIQRGGKSADHVIAVRSGPSQHRFTPQPKDDNLKDGRTYLVCYLGVMGPNDGIDLLLEAVHHVVHIRKRADVIFKLIGDGDIKPLMVDLAVRLKIQEHVKFLGRIPDGDVTALLSTADAGLAPDPKDELNDLSTMNKIIEYLAMGLPVVSFDLHEAKVSAASAAVYATANDVAEFADRLLELLDNPAQRQKMSDFGRRRFLDELAWEHQAPKLLRAYSLLLAVQQSPQTVAIQ